jgi:hypothetical protein
MEVIVATESVFELDKEIFLEQKTKLSTEKELEKYSRKGK